MCCFVGGLGGFFSLRYISTLGAWCSKVKVLVIDKTSECFQQRQPLCMYVHVSTS